MKEYKELIDSFCKLDKKVKHEEINNELQELLSFLHMLCMEKNLDSSILLHHEMNDYEKNNSEDEFLNSVYSYVISIKESLGKYLDE